MDFNRYDQRDPPRLRYDSYTEKTREIDRLNARLKRYRRWSNVVFVIAEVGLIALAVWYMFVSG